MNTKTNKIKEHLQTKGSITSWEAIQLYKATRLSAIIFNLRKQGFLIEDIWQESINKDGEKSRYVRYELDESQMMKNNENHIPIID